MRAEPTTTDSGIADQRLAQIEMWTQRINLSARRDWGFEGSFTDEVVWLIERLRTAELELDQTKESLRTTRLEQAAKAFQVDELETKVERLTAQLAAIEIRPESPSENLQDKQSGLRLTPPPDALILE